MNVTLFVTYLLVVIHATVAFPALNDNHDTSASFDVEETASNNLQGHSRTKRGVFNLIPIMQKDVVKPRTPFNLNNLIILDELNQIQLNRSKRGVFNLIPKSGGGDMTMAKLVAFEEQQSIEKPDWSDHKRKSHTRRKLIRLLKNLLREELGQDS